MNLKVQLAFCFLAIFGWNHYLLAQASVRGLVTDKQNTTPLGRAQLSLKQQSDKKGHVFNFFSYEDGSFILENVPVGIYDLECRIDGYVPQKIVGLELKNNSTKLAYLRMRAGVPQNAKEIDIIETYSALVSKPQRKSESAALLGDKLEDVPATMYVITADEIEERGYTSLDELLQDIPEIEIQDRADPFSYNITSVRGIEGNRKVILMMNGSRINSLGNSDMVIYKNINIRFAQQVEIIMGSAAATQGADGFSGVLVNIVTQSGLKGTTVQAQGSYGMYNTTDNALTSAWTNGKIAFSLYASFYNSNDPFMPKFYPNQYGAYANYQQTGQMPLDDSLNTLIQVNNPVHPYKTPSQSHFYLGRIEWKGLELSIYRNYSLQSSSLGLNPNYAIYDASAITSNQLNSLSAKYTLSPKGAKWTTQTVATWNVAITDPKTQQLNASFNYAPAYRFQVEDGGRILQTFAYQLNEKHRLAAEADFTSIQDLPMTQATNRMFSNDSVNLTSYYPIGTSSYSDSIGSYTATPIHFERKHRWNVGGMLQYQAIFSQKLYLTLSSRFDYNSLSGFNANPRLGIIYKPAKGWSIRLSTGSGAIQPSSLQLNGRDLWAYYPDTLDTARDFHSHFGMLPNPLLKPERILNNEIAFNYTRKNLLFNYVGFYNIITNSIVNQYYTDYGDQGDTIGLATIPQNTHQIRHIWGATFGLEWQSKFGQDDKGQVKTYLYYTYMDGAFQGNSNYQQTFAAKHTIKAGLLLRWARWSLDIRSVFRSPTYHFLEITEDTQESSPAYVVFNAFAYCKIWENKQKNTSIQLFVKAQNLLNSRYYNISYSGELSGDWVAQNPIRIVGGVSFRFR